MAGLVAFGMAYLFERATICHSERHRCHSERSEESIRVFARRERQYYVYILTNRSGTLYVGVTNDLERRIYEHKHKLLPGFAAKYNLTRLAYFEHTSDVEAAITREKEIKGWRREKKVALVESSNPQWEDLSLEWCSGREG